MGKANVAVLNASGYDAVVLGNNEGLTFPMPTIAEAYRGFARFSVLGTNLSETETGTQPDWMVPSLLVRCGELQVGLVGVTAYYPTFYTLLGWTISEPLEAVRAEAEELRRQGADVIVVLSHLGLTQDRLMAKDVAGIDVVLGGHTHHLLETPERIGRTWIAATGSLGKYIGDLAFRYHYKTGELELEQGRCLAVADYAEDPRLEAIVEHYKNQGALALEEPIATLRDRLSIRWDRESELGNLLAAGIRRWTGGELGLVNAGQLLADLEAGAVTAGMLLNMCPSPINPCLTLLTGQHLLEALEQSLLPEYYDKPIKGFGFRGKALGVLCVDGVTAEFYPNGEAMGKIRAVFINGEPLDTERRYRVGMIDMFTFGSGYLSLSQGAETRFYLPEFIRDVLREQLQRPEELRECQTVRWEALPSREET